MTVGDGKTEDYRRGYTAGYRRRVREEIESWRAVIEGGQILAFGELMKTLPFKDREAKRLDTVKLAHDAGIHGHSARGCPWCDDDPTDAGFGVSTYGAVPVPNCRAHGQPMMPGLRDAVTGRVEWHCVCSGISYLPVGKPHSGHYGAPAVKRYACADCSYASSNNNTLKQHQRATGHAASAQNPDYGAPEKVCRNALHRHKPGDAWLFSCSGSDAQNPAYGAPLVDGTGITSIMIDVPRIPDRYGFRECPFPPDQPGADPCAGGCSDPARHAEGGHDV